MRKEILAVRERVKLDPRGEITRWTVVEYMLDGKYGPFVFESPKEVFSWDAVKEDMKIQEQGITAVEG